MKSNLSRREFMQAGAGAAIASGVLSFSSLGRALASTSVGGYKALVCLLLNGGNDGHNWFVPMTNAAYNVYVAGRKDLAIAQSALLPLNGAPSNGIQYGLHPSCPELQTIFNAGHAAIVCNVGPLIQPTTATQARAGAVPLPPQLFSHISQSTEWQTSASQSQSSFGWGGKIGDLFAAQGPSANLAFNINVGGTNYWQQGRTTTPYALGLSGAPQLDAATNSYYRNGLRAQATQALIDQGANDSNLMVSAYSGIYRNAESKVTLINNAFAAAGDVSTVFPPAAANDWGLSQQLHEVARIIKAQSQIGDSRQLFFVQLGGFDTHSGQLATQSMLLGYVSRYVNAFWNAMGELGMQSNVTLFTMSDFGRTLTSNGNGADHGWGNHHIVVGGGVVGGQFYGKMPDLTIGGVDDFGQGRLVPTTAVDQYAATLSSWFGVADSDMNSIFSSLPNFPVRKLGFLG